MFKNQSSNYYEISVNLPLLPFTSLKIPFVITSSSLEQKMSPLNESFGEVGSVRQL